MAKTEGHKITTYYRQLNLHCILALQKYVQSGDKEAMHELRVSLKKLDTLFWIANKLLPEFSRRKLFSTYRNLFKRAGIIRDAQVQLDLLHKFDKEGSLQILGEHLTHQIDDQHKKLITSSSSIQLRLQKLPVSITPYFNQLKIKQVKRLGEQLITKQQKRWKHLPSIQKMHSARKPIKHILYLQELTTEAGKKQLTKKKQKRWNKLQQAIGNYHDCAELRRITKEYKDKRVIFPFQTELKHLHREIKQVASKIAD